MVIMLFSKASHSLFYKKITSDIIIHLSPKLEGNALFFVFKLNLNSEVAVAVVR